MPDFVIDENTQYNLVNALYACPHGVIEMSRDMENMVETSTNLASVKIDKEKGEIIVTTSQRSSVDSSKHDIASMVESVFILAGAKVEHGDGYPGWAPNTDSEIMKLSAQSYEKLFHKKPIVRSIHAGLECGLFLEKYPDLDMISFGPTLRAVHSPDERINIETVDKFWRHLIDVLESIK
jgi:dipeptidase D